MHMNMQHLEEDTEVSYHDFGTIDPYSPVAWMLRAVTDPSYCENWYKMQFEKDKMDFPDSDSDEEDSFGVNMQYPRSAKQPRQRPDLDRNAGMKDASPVHDFVCTDKPPPKPEPPRIDPDSAVGYMYRAAA